MCIHYIILKIKEGRASIERPVPLRSDSSGYVKFLQLNIISFCSDLIILLFVCCLIGTFDCGHTFSLSILWKSYNSVGVIMTIINLNRKWCLFVCFNVVNASRYGFISCVYLIL